MRSIILIAVIASLALTATGETLMLNPCASKPCKNEGVCLVVPGEEPHVLSNSYKCLCPLNTSGWNCEDLLRPKRDADDEETKEDQVAQVTEGLASSFLAGIYDFISSLTSASSTD